MNSETAEKSTGVADIQAGLSSEMVTVLLQKTGYRVELAGEQDGSPVLRSATGGVVFHITFSNPVSGLANTFQTARFFAALQIEGDLPLTIVNCWNASMRFGRLHVSGGLLVLDMDVIAAGGVTQAQFIGAVQIWDRLVQGLVAYLRDVLPKVANEAGAPAAAEQQAAAG